VRRTPELSNTDTEPVLIDALKLRDAALQHQCNHDDVGAQRSALAASWRIILSKIRSDTILRYRKFSRFSSLTRFIWLTLIPPYSLPPAVASYFVKAEFSDDFRHLHSLR